MPKFQGSTIESHYSPLLLRSLNQSTSSSHSLPPQCLLFSLPLKVLYSSPSSQDFITPSLLLNLFPRCLGYTLRSRCVLCVQCTSYVCLTLPPSPSVPSQLHSTLGTMGFKTEGPSALREKAATVTYLRRASSAIHSPTCMCLGRTTSLSNLNLVEPMWSWMRIAPSYRNVPCWKHPQR